MFMNNKDFSAKIKQIISSSDLDKDTQNQVVASLDAAVNEFVSEDKLKTKLGILYEYEKHYLDLLKEYKEEIKFANTIHEDLRRERASFFTQTLKEVTQTFRESQIDSSIASKWIEELVMSYTRSLDLGSDLARNQTIDIIGRLREESKKTIIDPDEKM